MPSPIPVSSMPLSFTPAAAETALVDQLFARVRLRNKLSRVKQGENEVLTGDTALELFSKTNLSVQVLSEIWTIADKNERGWLTPLQTAAAVRLIGWAQAGSKPTPELLEKTGPLAEIPDVPRAGPSKVASSVIPPFTPEDKAKFLKLFLSSGPTDGIISGDKAREIFSKSKLPAEKLSQIWELSDTEHRGALDSTDFAIAMHLIQGLMNNWFSVLPLSLPSGLYEQAAVEPTSTLLLTPAPLSPIRTSSSFSMATSRSPSIVSSNSHYLSVQTDVSRANSPRSSPISSRRPNDECVETSGWNIPSDVKAIADRQFDALDPLKNGFIHDNISLPFLLESKLPPEELAQIWTFADLNNILSPTSPMSPHDADIAPLTRQVQELQAAMAQMHKSHVEKTTAITNLTQENFTLRVMIEELQIQAANNESQKVVNQVLAKENEGLRTTTQQMQEALRQLQTSSSDVEMQRIQYEDLTRENERLHKQVTEMRESTTQLPWSGGDSELQTLINEDLARENARLRTEAREMQENVAQLQEATADYEEQRRLNAELLRDNERLQESARTAQTRFDAQRREIRQLSREVQRLKTQSQANAFAGPSGSRDADVPPPAYHEVDLSAIS
ncbi:hypothetical protein B0H15DRAFT_950066 [Mycena belliarum]|uniref:EH domain-containing protein n=1 Tax=Mycena belliarum TaxID=1033014 RepID=A0AAD6U233_9AGAR|nr:hypothetical protein B0H15DRAFT_950066 [Mycena belliae]